MINYILKSVEKGNVNKYDIDYYKVGDVVTLTIGSDIKIEAEIVYVGKLSIELLSDTKETYYFRPWTQNLTFSKDSACYKVYNVKFHLSKGEKVRLNIHTSFSQQSSTAVFIGFAVMNKTRYSVIVADNGIIYHVHARNIFEKLPTGREG